MTATLPTRPAVATTGPDYATRCLGYDPHELAAIPAETTDWFEGVGNPFSIGLIDHDEVVLGVGCGSGTDLLLAGRRVDRSGRVIGVDPRLAMRERAWRSAMRMGLGGIVEIRGGRIDRLPVATASVDLVICNGAISRVSDWPRAMAEIVRVLAPGGRLFMAEVVDAEMTAGDLLALAREAGFEYGELVGYRDGYRDGERVRGAHIFAHR